jgi:hypothetical protein
MKQLSRLSYCLALLTASLTFLGGCVTTRLTQPVTSFQESINTSACAIGIYYNTLNEFEREIYLDECLYNPSKEVLSIDASGMPTPLLGKSFNAKSIKARTDAIILLGIYAKRLTELAGSDAPLRFKENATILGDNLFNLQNTFGQLSKSDVTAKNYTGPIGTLVGVVGNIYLEQKRDAALKTAIEEGAPSVRKILLLLQKDFAEVIDLLKTSGLKEKLAIRVSYYNDHRKSFNFEKRKQLLADIKETGSSYEASVAANPANLVQAMSDAHESLVKYALLPNTPQNLSELLTSLETFKIRADESISAVKKIRD